MRNFLAGAGVTCALLAGVSGIATAAPAPTDTNVTISKKVTFEIQDPQFSQVAVSLKVVCDPSLGSLSLNVQVFQGSVAGFGFVPSAPCTGKKESVVAHVQSNFGSVYTEGSARVVVTDFAHSNQFSANVRIG